MIKAIVLKAFAILRLVAAMSVLAFGALVACAPVAHAEAPLRPHQVPGYYRLMVGDFEVTALYDGGVGIDSALLRGNAQQIRALLRRSMYEDPKDVLGSVAGYLVNTGSKLVLIDAGAGGHWGGPTLGRLVANLRASGYSPDQVDVVLITHLHADHVGGIYGADGSRIFRNAEIRMAKADSDFWLSTDIAAKAPPEAQVFFQVARDAAAPYVAAGKWRPFEGTDPIVPGVRPYPIVGHTPGHMGYEVTSKGQSLLVWGDVVHVMAVQMTRPGVGIAFDIDGPTAIKARGELFAKLSASKTLVAGAHMPFPSLGYLRREGSGYEWVPVVFKDLSTTAGAELSEARARELIAPWYGLFNQPVAADMVKAVHEQLSPDYQSCWGVLPGECWGREQSMKVVANFAKSIPDMKFDIKEVLVSENRVIVRGEVSGTPSGDLFGVPHGGKSFRIMAIDIQTIRDGKIVQTHHLENWLSALGQLRTKQP